MENECEALPGVAYPRVRDNCSTVNTKTGYDDDDDIYAYSGSLYMRIAVALLNTRLYTYFIL